MVQWEYRNRGDEWYAAQRISAALRREFEDMNIVEAQVTYQDGAVKTYRRRAPEPIYVTKNVQDVRVGDVVKGFGEIRWIVQSKDRVTLENGYEGQSHRPDLNVEVEQR